MDDYQTEIFNVSTYVYENITELAHNNPEKYRSYSLVFLLTVVIIIIFIGNVLVIFAVLFTPKLRTITNFFVVSLAISDLLVAIIVMPAAIYTNLTGYWPFSKLMCDIWTSADITLCTASILNLCAISIDRYFAITQPLKYSKRRRSKKLALVMLLVVWLTAFLIALPLFFGWHEKNRYTIKKCRYNRNQSYVIFSASLSFFIPMIVMVYVYAKIAYVIANRVNRLEQTMMGHSKKHAGRKSMTAVLYTNNGDHITIDKPEDYLDNECLRSPQSQTKRNPETAATAAAINSESVRISSFKRETKTAKTLSIVVGGFIIFWLPFFVYYILIPFLPPDKINSTLMAYFTWLGWLNSAINPFIYAFHNADFRTAFANILVNPISTFRDRNQTTARRTLHANLQNEAMLSEKSKHRRTS